MLLADLCAGITIATTLILHLGNSLQIWHLYVAEAMLGVCDSFQLPAFSAATSVLVRKDQYARASGLRSFAVSTAQFGAPSLAGGFKPDAISVQAGETITLRFHAADVTHGIAIGPALGVDLGDIDPGHVKEVTLTFDQSGTYTFYCTTWCSLNHWQMRGVIDVAGSKPGVTDPVIVELATQGVNIDANTMGNMSMSELPAPLRNWHPRPEHGQALAMHITLPTELSDIPWRRSHTPLEALNKLAALNPSVPQTDLADVIAFLWSKAPVDTTANLYAKIAQPVTAKLEKGTAWLPNLR